MAGGSSLADHSVLRCSSVWGGVSWVLVKSGSKDLEPLCEQAEEKFGVSISCCVVRDLVSGSCEVFGASDDLADLIEGILNEEYEGMNLSADDLSPPSLLKPGREKVLRDVLRLLFDTTYSSDGLVAFLEHNGITVVAASG